MKLGRKQIISIFLLFLFGGSIFISAANLFLQPKKPQALIAVIDTSMGVFEVELDVENAPNTVVNFVNYIESDYYDGLCFHRVMSGFMIQGGGFKPDGEIKTPNDPVASESNNGLSNLNGTIAMARSTDPDSASSQFFINTEDNTFLDYTGADNPGYTVFGEVVSGMDVVMAIDGVETSIHEAYFPEFDYTTTLEDWPVETVLINSITIKGS